MKVKQLLQELENYEPEAEVFVSEEGKTHQKGFGILQRTGELMKLTIVGEGIEINSVKDGDDGNQKR